MLLGFAASPLVFPFVAGESLLYVAVDLGLVSEVHLAIVRRVVVAWLLGIAAAEALGC